MKQRIPVVMYHTIGIVNKNWHWNFLTCPYKRFEDQLKWLKKTRYNTLNFQEVYDYIINDKPVPKKSVFLTFDDGYLDNYVFAYPLLKKYGLKGTIFINPDFVEKSGKCRKTLLDIKEDKEALELENIGFCNWNELKKMDSEGILEVQSHAKTHTWYPISDNIIDFRHPGDDYGWMDWNEYPEEKPYLQCIIDEKVRLGHAIFEHEKALSSKRVFINTEFQNKLQTYVKKNGEKLFFEKLGWKEELFRYANEIKKDYPIITKQETQEEYLDRIKYELEFTKNELEKRLNKNVNFICWPGGSATKEGVKIANELGYLMSTAAGDISKIRKKITNSPDYKINRISRITPIMYNTWSKDDENSIIRYSPGFFFILQLLRFKNKYFAKHWMRLVSYLIYKLRLFV